MTSSRPYARQFAEFATSTTARQLSPERMERAVTYALDTLAVTLAGASAASSTPMARMLERDRTSGRATVCGAGRIASPWDAALANGTMAHGLELDDDHRIAVLHPGAVIVPAAFAVAEAEGVSGKEFLAALLAGYEITCRLGEALGGRQFYHGIHPTPVCGVFGAALASAMLLGLDAAQMTRALGIAGTQASGLTEWRSDGSWIKRLHPGRAAHAGVIAAYLAQSGFTGPATIIEGPNGFFKALGFGEPIDHDVLLAKLGSDFHALGTAIKPYPCCRFAHGTIDLALEAAASGLVPAKIRKIKIGIYRTDVLSYRPIPLNAVDAQFNLPYVIATALATGRIGLSDFTETAIARKDVLRLTHVTEVVEEPDYCAKYPKDYWTDLVIEREDAEPIRLLSTCPSGDPEAERYRKDPRRFHGEAKEKAHALLIECGFGDRAEQFCAAVEALPSAKDLTSVAATLGRATVKT